MGELLAMTEKENFRVLQTQRKIKTTFWHLLVTEGFTNISVKQILQGANINRSTFYTYFDNKEDLLNTIEMDLFNDFKDIAQMLPLTEVTALHPRKKIIQEYYHQFVQYIYQNGEKFSLLASPQGDPAFIAKLLDFDQSIWQTNQIMKNLTVPQHYAFTGLLALATSLINDWAKNGFQESPQVFEKILSAMITPILLGNLFKKNVN